MRHRLGIVILAAAATAGGCVHQDDRPPLTGPSALAQSVAVTANPDVLYLGQNGPGQSATIIVKVIDESGNPETDRTGCPARHPRRVDDPGLWNPDISITSRRAATALRRRSSRRREETRCPPSARGFNPGNTVDDSGHPGRHEFPDR